MKLGLTQEYHFWVLHEGLSDTQYLLLHFFRQCPPDILALMVSKVYPGVSKVFTSFQECSREGYVNITPKPWHACMHAYQRVQEILMRVL